VGGNGQWDVPYSLAGGGLVIKECFGLRDLPVSVEVLVFLVWDPGAVRCFVVDEHAEGLLPRESIQPVDGEVGDDVRRIAGNGRAARLVDHFRVEVVTLSRKDLPGIESARQGLPVLTQVPFPEKGSLVARFVEYVHERGYPVVHLGPDGGYAVDMAVGPCEDRRPGGTADRVGAEDGIHAHASLGDAVKVRRLVHPAAVCRNGWGAGVMGHD